MGRRCWGALGSGSGANHVVTARLPHCRPFKASGRIAHTAAELGSVPQLRHWLLPVLPAARKEHCQRAFLPSCSYLEYPSTL